MANHYCSPSGKSSGVGSGSNNNNDSSSNERDLDEQKKRKRMVSNRESARRSRLRKQKLENDLTAQVSDLNKEKKVLMTGINRTSHKYLIIEAENRVLRAQMAELSHRLLSLHEIIISFINLSNNGNIYYSTATNQAQATDHNFTDSYNMNAMAAVDMNLHY